jgi:hypothetical protein
MGMVDPDVCVCVSSRPTYNCRNISGVTGCFTKI